MAQARVDYWTSVQGESAKQKEESGEVENNEESGVENGESVDKQSGDIDVQEEGENNNNLPNNQKVNEPKPISNGVFGNIYDQFKGKVKEAFEFLMKHKSGDLLGVFHRDEIGDIDLVWGDKKGGLSHIFDSHVGKSRSFETQNDAIDAIKDIIQTGSIKTSKDKEKVIISKGNNVVVLRKNIRDNGKKLYDKNWILTAYNPESEDKKRPAVNGTAGFNDNQGGTAPATGLSTGKGKSEETKKQENGDKKSIIGEEEAPSGVVENDEESKGGEKATGSFSPSKILYSRVVEYGKKKGYKIYSVSYLNYNGKPGLPVSVLAKSPKEAKETFNKGAFEGSKITNVSEKEVQDFDYDGFYEVSDSIFAEAQKDGVTKKASEEINREYEKMNGIAPRAGESQEDYLRRVLEFKEKKKAETETASSDVDAQGNPTDENGKLITEKVGSVDELTDEDFANPTRSVELPKIPNNVDAAIGANGKPVVIKKNIFEKNRDTHKFTPEQSRNILLSALYNPNIVGQTQPKVRKNYWVAIKIDEKSPITILEVNENKDNVEVVGWYSLDNRNLERIKRQAEREGGELLILSNDKVESLSTPTDGLSSNDKDNTKNSEKQENGDKKSYSVGSVIMLGNAADNLIDEYSIAKGNKASEEELDKIVEDSGVDLEREIGEREQGIEKLKDQIDKSRKDHEDKLTGIRERNAKSAEMSQALQKEKAKLLGNPKTAEEADKAYGKLSAEDKANFDAITEQQKALPFEEERSLTLGLGKASLQLQQDALKQLREIKDRKNGGSAKDKAPFQAKSENSKKGVSIKTRSARFTEWDKTFGNINAQIAILSLIGGKTSKRAIAYLLKKKAAIVEKYIGEINDGHKVNVCATEEDFKKELSKFGNYMEDYEAVREKGCTVYGVALPDGTIAINSEFTRKLQDSDGLYGTFFHERQHVKNGTNGVEKMMAEVDRESLVELTKNLSRSDVYDDYETAELIDEAVAFALQEMYDGVKAEDLTDDKKLQTVLNKIYNEQRQEEERRFGTSRNPAFGRTLVNRNDEGSRGQNGQDNEGESGNGSLGRNDERIAAQAGGGGALFQAVGSQRRFGGNSGYVGYSKSKRAVQAENSGLRNSSQMNKEFADEVNDLVAKTTSKPSNITLKQIKEALPKIKADEWHHTSMYGNKTNYYSAETIADYFTPESEEEKTRKQDYESAKAEYGKAVAEADKLVIDSLPLVEVDTAIGKRKAYKAKNGLYVEVNNNRNSDASRIFAIKELEGEEPFVISEYSEWAHEHSAEFNEALTEFNTLLAQARNKIPKELNNKIKELNDKIDNLEKVVPVPKNARFQAIGDGNTEKVTLQNGLYSNAEKGILDIKQDKATPEQWLAMLTKNGGLKAGEDKWIGLSDFLKGSSEKSLTKQQLLDYVRKNSIRIEETSFGETSRLPENIKEDYYDEFVETYNSLLEKYPEKIEEEYESEHERPDTNNYDELESWMNDMQYYVHEKVEEKDNDMLLEEAVSIMDEKYPEYTGVFNIFIGDGITVNEGVYEQNTSDNKDVASNQKLINSTRLDYTTSKLDNKKEIALSIPNIESWDTDDDIHFGADTNGKVVAWARFGETTDAEGKRVLVIDEIQSNRHQEGREKGYKSDANPDGIPAAPFEKNWHELAFKRMLRYAAENGFDKMAWTTGEQQAERYNLQKQVDRIVIDENDGKYTVMVRKNGEADLTAVEEDVSPERLADIVGKTIAKQAIEEGGADITGEGLKIGGQGMKGFYDKILPDFANKYGKKWGAKASEVTMPKLNSKDRVMHSIDITPEMKESVMGQGQALFQAKGKAYGKDHPYGNRKLDKNELRKVQTEVKRKNYDTVGRDLIIIDNFAYLTDHPRSSELDSYINDGGDGIGIVRKTKIENDFAKETQKLIKQDIQDERTAKETDKISDRSEFDGRRDRVNDVYSDNEGDGGSDVALDKRTLQRTPDKRTNTGNGNGYSGANTDSRGLAEFEEDKDGHVRMQAVYHGSPYDFTKFLLSQIGTGEGNLAFGYGIYTSEIEDVAKSYAYSLSPTILYKDKKLNLGSTTDNAVVFNIINDAKGDLKKAIASAKKYEKSIDKEEHKAAADQAAYVVSFLEGTKQSDWTYEEHKRNLYTVEIPDNNGSNYLVYEKNVDDNTRSAIAKALYDRLINEDEDGLYDSDQARKELKKELAQTFGVDEDSNWTAKKDFKIDGNNFYGGISSYLDSDEAASKFLDAQGIVGVSYPGGSLSEMKDNGKRNYVLFNENNLQITDHARFQAKGNAKGNSIKKESLVKEPQDLTTTIVSSTSDGAKVGIKIETAKENLKNLSNSYRGIKQSRGFLSDLNRALGNNENGIESHYFNFENANRDLITIRTSNHNTNSDNFSPFENVISIVIKSKRTPNSFKGDNNVNLKEYVYFKERIKRTDGDILSKIADSINDLLSNGIFVDKTGIAIENVIPLSQRFNEKNKDARFQIGKARKEQMRDGLMTKLTNATPESVENTISEIEKLGEQTKKGGDSKIEKVAYNWATNGTVILPEDNGKILQAVKIATIHKVDPMTFKSPMELINQFAGGEVKENSIDPDSVAELTNKVDYGNGLVVYDVQNDKEGQQAMRDVMNSHLGKNVSPWCLLQADENGELTDDSWRYWNNYNSVRKRAAFYNGKLIAFCASKDGTNTWWDKQDKPHKGIPFLGKLNQASKDLLLSKNKNIDTKGIVGTTEFDEDAKKYSDNQTSFYRGTRRDGQYETWFDNGQQQERSNYKNWKKHGLSETWYENGQMAMRDDYTEDNYNSSETWYENGLQKERIVFKDKNSFLNESWYENGKRKERLDVKNGKRNLYESWYESGQREMYINYKDGKEDGLYESWYENGQQKERFNYKDGKKNGLQESWYKNGQIERRNNYKNERLNGLDEQWRDNGQIYESTNYKEGEKYGLYERWYGNGKIEVRENFKNGEWDGLQEVWYENGQKRHRANYKDGKKNGLYEEWDKNGNREVIENYKEDKRNGLSESWGLLGILKKRVYYENDAVVEKNKDELDELSKQAENKSKMLDEVGGAATMRMQAIGEQGARALDRAEEATTRLDNLSVARDMEKAKKGAKSIKLATGWERGADGKWRYETNDFNITLRGDANIKRQQEKQPWYKELNDLTDKIIKGDDNYTKEEFARFSDLVDKETEWEKSLPQIDRKFLEDYVIGDDIFKAYPQLKGVEIVFINDPKDGYAGKWSSKNNTIFINEAYDEPTKEVLIHEVQHAIQGIEGFAEGGNAGIKDKALLKIKSIRDLVSNRLNKFGYEKWLNNYLKNATKDELEKINADNRPLKFARLFADNYEGENKSDIADFVESRTQEIEKTEKQYGGSNSIYSPTSGFDYYKHLSGEVEARNVQTRVDMTYDQRRNSLMSETEDVAREDQIFINDGLGGGARFQAMGDGKSSFKKRQAEAETNRGTVMPDLANKEVVITNVPRHKYKGERILDQAVEAAKKRYNREIANKETGKVRYEPVLLPYSNNGVNFEYTITPNSLNEAAHKSSKSENLGVHVAVMDKLDEVIGNSIEYEEHPDVEKNKEGERVWSNNHNKDVLIHRFVGAITIDGKPYRVKTTIKEYLDNSTENKHYAYEVTKIEVLDENTPNTSNGAPAVKNGTMRTANLLKGVEKSYDKGKKILDESEDLTFVNKSGDVRFQAVGDAAPKQKDYASMNEWFEAYKDWAMFGGSPENMAASSSSRSSMQNSYSALRKEISTERGDVQTNIKKAIDFARQALPKSMMSSADVKQLLTNVRNATTNWQLLKSMNKIYDVVLESQQKASRDSLDKLLKTKISKIDDNRIKKGVKLDADTIELFDLIKEYTKLDFTQVGLRLQDETSFLDDLIEQEMDARKNGEDTANITARKLAAVRRLKNAGYTVKAYYGTNNGKVTVFDTSKSNGSVSRNHINAFMFSSSKHVADYL